jgi:uncharacterized membrane protein YccC
MNPQIGAALIAVGGALIGAISVIGGVYLTVRGGRKQKRGELAAAALSDYVKAMARSATVRRLRDHAESLSDGDSKKRIFKEALDIDLEARETAAHAKTMLLAFADSDALSDLASWDTEPVARDSDQQRALLRVVNDIRRQIDTKADTVNESIGLSLMFGQHTSGEHADNPDR